MDLTRSPSTWSLLGRAGFKGNNKSALAKLPESILPDEPIRLLHQELNKNQLEAFNQLCGWKANQYKPIHPCFLHTLAFPVHLKLMLQSSFPFKLLGLVHLKNHIRQLRPVFPGEVIDIDCAFAGLAEHDKGWIFDINTDVCVEGELVWQSKSTNLFLSKQRTKQPSGSVTPPDLMTDVITTQSFDADLGLRYARVSGDWNLIHLYPLSAKLFGFKRHIAHGMYSKAFCLSAFEEQLGNKFYVDVEFKRPVFLPCETRLCGKTTGSGSSFELQSANGETLHLSGKIEHQ